MSQDGVKHFGSPLNPRRTSFIAQTPPSPGSINSPRPYIRQSRYDYDVSGAMNRLRSSMVGEAPPPPLTTDSSSTLEALGSRSDENQVENGRPKLVLLRDRINAAMGQVPAITLIAMFHLMIGIPFGVSYFPMYWSSHAAPEDLDGEGSAPFPLPGKEALGIRMFLFSTIVGQLVFTFKSQFSNPIGLQMVENVPFCHELSAIVISHQGFGIDAISTLMVMFGLSSIFVGTLFWLLGKFKLGRIVYFFPTHVLIGCIGGIGLYISKTGIEVTIGDTFSITNIVEKFDLLLVVLLFELVLRVLEQVTKDDQGKQTYTLLSPIYFCAITPIFYLGLWLFKVSVAEAVDRGFFFPSLDSDESQSSEPDGNWLVEIFTDEHVWDMWSAIHFPSVSWVAIWDSIPTLVALTLFSLIHVPVNIPAFSISTNTEVDMNNEMIAHGWSNILAGLVDGLQNYMAYTQSVLYDRSGGTGRPSGVAVAAATTILFFIGPTIASFIPKCMAGVLLLHVGADLFLEGVWDTYGKFDLLEYSGIWLIVIVMTLYGMEAAMIAGGIAAVSTYAVQTVAYLNPIRGSMKATTLRSSCRTRGYEANAILDGNEGRGKIQVVQLHGHLFFGNLANFTDQMEALVSSKNMHDDTPLVVILDFGLVLGIDSSAAQAIIKMKDKFLKKHKVKLCIFVTGSTSGFPTEYDLSQQLVSGLKMHSRKTEMEMVNEKTALLGHGEVEDTLERIINIYQGSNVCESLDEALMYAENAMIARKDPSLLRTEIEPQYSSKAYSSEDERDIVLMHLRNISPIEIADGDLEILFSVMHREVYHKDEMIWKQHAVSDCAKLLVFGMLISELEEEAGTTETIARGNMIGEVGLVNRAVRMSSVRCLSDEAIVYSLNRAAYEDLVRMQPQVARYIDLICVNYLVSRVQNVSNRIFETRCLPI